MKHWAVLETSVHRILCSVQTADVHTADVFLRLLKSGCPVPLLDLRALSYHEISLSLAQHILDHPGKLKSACLATLQYPAAGNVLKHRQT